MDETVSTLFPAEYLGACDLLGKDYVVTITSVQKADVVLSGGRKEAKVIIRLKGTDKKWIVCKTNGYALGVLLGAKAASWVGKRVSLTPDVDLFQGVEVPCVRISDSPDAAQDRRDAYLGALRGTRQGGKLIARLKQVLATLESTTS